VIASHHLIMDHSFLNRQPLTHQNIVDPPADIPLSSLEHLRPIAELFFLRIHNSIGINKTQVKYFGQVASLLVCEARFIFVVFWLSKIQLCMCQVHVSKHYHIFDFQ